MAAVAAAQRLTEAHRIAQSRLGARTVLAMRRIWPLLDPNDLDGTFDRWMGTAEPIIQAQRSSSSTLASNYVTAYRTVELGTVSGTVPTLASAAATEALEVSLLVTGPVSIRSALGRGVPIGEAMVTAEAKSAAAAMRHALNGGRDTVLRTVRDDRAAHGWARAASGRACAFCALLASRGAVYSEDTVDFRAHDHCSCAVEPIYRHDAALPSGSQRYAALYQQAKDADGDTLANFRRLVAA